MDGDGEAGSGGEFIAVNRKFEWRLRRLSILLSTLSGCL